MRWARSSRASWSTARRFKELGAVASEELAELTPIDRTPQLAQAPELRPVQPDETGAEAA